MIPVKQWYSRKEAAIYLTAQGYPIAPQTLANLAANQNARRGPSFVRQGWNLVQYEREALDRWLQSRRQLIA